MWIICLQILMGWTGVSLLGALALGHFLCEAPQQEEWAAPSDFL